MRLTLVACVGLALLTVAAGFTSLGHDRFLAPRAILRRRQATTTTMRASSSFVVDVVKRVRPGLVRIDLTGPRNATSGTGTGLVFDAAAGLIVTNAHVASAASSTSVTLYTGANVSAELVGRADGCDVALLRVNPDDLVFLRDGADGGGGAIVLGSREPLELGEHAIALGFGAEQVMCSLGIVSALSTRRVSGQSRGQEERRRERRQGRPLQRPDDDAAEAADDGDSVPVVITDASLVFGNSGGPLLNEWGEVIGLNTAIEMRGSTIGIAIAIEKVAEVVGEILAHRAALDASESTRSEVLLYNDPMNRKARVEEVLLAVFGMDKARANEVMMRAHKTGRASCGTFSNEEAGRLHGEMGKADVLSEVVRLMKTEEAATPRPTRRAWSGSMYPS